MNLESNINDLAARMESRIASLGGDFEVSVENHVSYAAAVDQGSVRIMKGLVNSVEDREAASERRHARDGEPKWTGHNGFEVERGEDWTKIVIPPAGIIATSSEPIRKFTLDQLKRLAQEPAAEVRTDIANGMQAILVQTTEDLAFDTGVLAGGWKVAKR